MNTLYSAQNVCAQAMAAPSSIRPHLRLRPVDKKYIISQMHGVVCLMSSSLLLKCSLKCVYKALERQQQQQQQLPPVSIACGEGSSPSRGTSQLSADFAVLLHYWPSPLPQEEEDVVFILPDCIAE